MGQKQTKTATTTNPKSTFTPEVEVVHEKTQNAHYGEVKTVKVKETEQVLLLKEIVVNTKQAFDAEVEFLNNRVELAHPNVTEIVGFNTKDQQNFCSTYYKLSIYLENLEHTLQTQIDERAKTTTYATELELLQVADSLISGLSYFQSQGFNHGDIRPENVLIGTTTYKLSDPSLAAQKGQNGLSLAIISAKKTFLAPELVAQVPKNDFEIKTDKYKADVFSLGLTLLSLATLQSVEDLYNFEEGTFNQTLLAERLQTVALRYSTFTTDLISSMLKVEVESRPDFVVLSNTLLPYQEQIRTGVTPFQGEVRGETAKRSALPDTYVSTSYTNPTTDDLEARIKAALERSEQTFKAVAARDLTYLNSSTTGTTGDLAKSYVGTTATGTTSNTTVPITTTTTTTYTYTPVTTTYTPATTYTYNTNYSGYTNQYGETKTEAYTPSKATTTDKNTTSFTEKVENTVQQVVDTVTTKVENLTGREDEKKTQETTQATVNA